LRTCETSAKRCSFNEQPEICQSNDDDDDDDDDDNNNEDDNMTTMSELSISE